MRPTPPGNLKAFVVVSLLMVSVAPLPAGASPEGAVVSSFGTCVAIYDLHESPRYMSGTDVPSQWPATDDEDKLSVRPLSHEVAYFDWQSETRDSNGKLVKVVYRVTGVTNKVTCAVAKVLCDLRDRTDALLAWVDLALGLAAANDLEALPAPPLCHDRAGGSP